MHTFERTLLIAFFGNFIINTVIAAFVALIPPQQGGGIFTPQYIVFVIAAAIVAGLTAWWYLGTERGEGALKRAVIFGAWAFLISLVTTFITGTANVLMQTGSFAQVINIIPNFWPFLRSWSTLVLLGYWVIPAAIVGALAQRRADTPHSAM